jgi:hypothetical protein
MQKDVHVFAQLSFSSFPFIEDRRYLEYLHCIGGLQQIFRQQQAIPYYIPAKE